jgi:Na+/melibiose symporter-like transporter
MQLRTFRFWISTVATAVSCLIMSVLLAQLIFLQMLAVGVIAIALVLWLAFTVVQLCREPRFSDLYYVRLRKDIAQEYATVRQQAHLQQEEAEYQAQQAQMQRTQIRSVLVTQKQPRLKHKKQQAS